MPILLLLLAGVAVVAIARASASSNAPQLPPGTGTGTGAGSAGGSAPPMVAELTGGEKLALASSLGARWVSHEKMNAAGDADSMDLGAPGVPGDGSAATVVAGANVQHNLFVLVDSRTSPTAIMVPASDSAAGKYASSGHWAIFLRPGEAATLFKSAGLDLGDILKPPSTPKGAGGGEVHMLGPQVPPAPSPLALPPAALSHALASNATVDIQDLPDGDVSDGFALRAVREAYKLYLAGHPAQASYYEDASRMLNAKGYTTAAIQAYQASVALRA